MARLAMDPRGRPLMEDAEFMGKLRQVAAHPDLLNAMLGDPKVQLVGGAGRGFFWGGGAGAWPARRIPRQRARARTAEHTHTHHQFHTRVRAHTAIAHHPFAR